MSRYPPCVGVLVLLLWLAAGSAPIRAQSVDPAPTPASPGASPERGESEQNVVTVPTTRSMRRFGHHFRITHRFARDLRRDGFGDMLANLFGLDSGAIIGLDYRFAPLANAQLGVYRSMLSRTIQFSGRYDAVPQSDTVPVAVSGLVSVEGTDNFRDDHAPVVGAVLSRTYGRRLALHASPTFVWHSRIPGAGTVAGEEGLDHDTAYVGLGARVQFLETAFVALEFTPRLTGFAPGRGAWGIGIEKQTRGHLFQLNFSNSFGTTYGQIARGGEPGNIYLGFNIARRF